MPTAEHVEREVAEAVVVAVEEAAFLMPVQRVVGGIEIKRDLPGCLLVRVEKEVDEQRLDRVRVGSEFGVARGLGAAQFQPVQRALARQRRAITPPRGKLPSGGFPPAPQVEPWPPPPASVAITGS
jgi:hypothetical protein